jgi:hypothetical protein
MALEHSEAPSPLVRLGERTLVHQDAIEAARRVALGLFARAPAFTTMEFRDALVG